MGENKSANFSTLPYQNANWPAVVNQLNDALQICNAYTIFQAEAKNTATCKKFLDKIFESLEHAHLLVETVDSKLKYIAVYQQTSDFLETQPACKIEVFQGLLTYFKGLCDEGDSNKQYVDSFVTDTLPTIIRFVLVQKDQPIELPSDLKTEDRICYNDGDIQVYGIEVPRLYVASAVASMFLCLTTYHSKDFPLASYENFYDFLTGCYVAGAQIAKLKMVLNYFNSISLVQGGPPGSLNFRLIAKSELGDDLGVWGEGNPLCPLKVEEDRALEDGGEKVLQVDFANEFIGGGVLDCGRVQEEIRFCTAPELQCSMLFMRCMLPNEAIQISGFQTFSSYSGYCDNLEYAGSLQDPIKRDDDGTPLSFLTAIDAVPYSGSNSHKQYTPTCMLRDLNKAYVGFFQNPVLDSKSVSSTACESHRTERVVDTPPKPDIPTIHRYAESLTQKLMADIRYGLRLVVPDYFGFNVVHYDPLKEQPMESTDSADPPSTMLDNDMAINLSRSDEPISHEVIDNLAKLSDIPPSTYPDTSCIYTNSQSFPRSIPSSSVVTQSSSQIISHELEGYADSMAAQIVQDSLSSLQSPSLTNSGLATHLELDESAETVNNSTTPPAFCRASSSAMDVDMKISVDVEITNADSGNCHIDVEMSASSSNNIDIDMVMDTSSSQFPAIDIDIDVVVSPTQSSNTDINSSLNDSADISQAASQMYVDSSLSRYSISDGVKQLINRYAEKVSADVISDAYSELRERRRLFIENNVTSTEFNVARKMSDDVIGHIFTELHNEAANSISDTEKLNKVPESPQLVNFASNLVCDVIAEAKSDWLPQTTLNVPPFSPSSKRARSHSGSQCRVPQLARRSSAPVSAPSSKLKPLMRRGSEPAVLFRTRSPHHDSGPKPFDYIREEFCRPKNVSASGFNPASRDKAASQQLWTQLNKHSTGDDAEVNESTGVPKYRPSKYSKHTKSAQSESDRVHHVAQRTLASCEEEDMLPLDEEFVLERVTSPPSSQLGASNIDRVAELPLTGSASRPCILTSSASTSSSQEIYVETNLLLRENSYTTSPISPMQHQYLRLFSEVLAENILHESLGKIERNIKSEEKRLAKVAEEEEQIVEGAESKSKHIKMKEPCRPIATGNWGCGVFGGDPQLKSLLQWIAASKAKCPKLIYYTFGDARVAGRKLSDVVDLIGFMSTDEVLHLIVEYGEKKATGSTTKTLFQYITTTMADQEEQCTGSI